MKKSLFVILSFSIITCFSFAYEKEAFKDVDFVAFEQNTFVIGENCQTYTAQRTVSPFLLNKYETTYNLWYKIRKQAEKIGYHFENPGQEGSLGRRGKVPSSKVMAQPVTMISWYDAVIWCNAYSEINNLTPCYTYKGQVLKDSSDTARLDLCEFDIKADGYRLPTEAEWELAARYSNDKILRADNPSGNSYWNFENADATRTVGTSGTPFREDAPPQPSSGESNSAGLYDMSGNVLEFCWDWFADYSKQPEGEQPTGPSIGTQRVSRGGSWSPYTLFIYAGDRYYFNPSEYYNYLGFRIAKSK